MRRALALTIAGLALAAPVQTAQAGPVETVVGIACHALWPTLYRLQPALEDFPVTGNPTDTVCMRG